MVRNEVRHIDGDACTLSAERVPRLMPEKMLHDNANAYDGGTDYSYAASLHSIKSA
jgi:hypothetical protein